MEDFCPELFSDAVSLSDFTALMSTTKDTLGYREGGVTVPEEVVKKAAGILADQLPVLKYYHIRERSSWGIKDTQNCFQLGYSQ